MKLIILVFCFMAIINAQSNFPDISRMIDAGEFREAEEKIDLYLSGGQLDKPDILDLKFQKEKMKRIKKDFRKSIDDILNYVKKYYPEVSKSQIEEWEKDGSLEFKIIDGEKFYFNRSHTNLFRINKDAKERKIKVDGNNKDGLDIFLEKYLPEVVSESKKENAVFTKPERIKYTYTLTVDPDAVPEGEIIRCWLPYPREGIKRQSDLKLLGANTDNYIIAPNNYKHTTLYMEKSAVRGKPTVFEYSVSYTGINEWREFGKETAESYNTESELYKKFTAERYPHLVFTDKIKKLSERIVGEETNKYEIAKKIYKWINDNIPWAGAREYSTIGNISDYCVTNGRGDCGIKTLTFMTLARYNGIPVKWQSGWMLHPGEVNLHDWAEIYFEGTGWLPVDQSFGLVDTDDEDVKWFFFGGLDAYHLIVNDDYSAPLYPSKIYPRSETVDFQRGEVEWKGGNLYFDEWDYHMDVEYLD